MRKYNDGNEPKTPQQAYSEYIKSHEPTQAQKRKQERRRAVQKRQDAAEIRGCIIMLVHFIGLLVSIGTLLYVMQF